MRKPICPRRHLVTFTPFQKSARLARKLQDTISLRKSQFPRHRLLLEHPKCNEISARTNGHDSCQVAPPRRSNNRASVLPSSARNKLAKRTVAPQFFHVNLFTWRTSFVVLALLILTSCGCSRFRLDTPNVDLEWQQDSGSSTNHIK